MKNEPSAAFSRCGYDLVDMYFDPEGEKSVAELILEECHFITKPAAETDSVSDSHDSKSCSQNGMESRHASEDMPSLRPDGGKKRSLMAMVTYAAAHLQSLQMQSGK